MLTLNEDVGIGNTNKDKDLHVKGDERITGDIYYGTDSSTYSKPDYVFQEDYKKDYTIEQVDDFIKRNNHLPWVTPAGMEKEGINFTRMAFETLESTENIQKQVIRLKKENKQLKNDIKQLKKVIKSRDKKIKWIMKKLRSME